VLVVVVTLFVGFMLLLGVLVFVTHLVETRPVSYLVPAPADDPEHAKLAPVGALKGPKLARGEGFNPYESPQGVEYAAGQNQSAAALGFTPHGLYAHRKGGQYKIHVSLWTSPDRRTLAVIGWGTIMKIVASKTLLYSRLDDGTVLLTADKLPGNDTPGLYEIVVVQNAPLDALVRRHEKRLAESRAKPVPFDGPDALADYDAVLSARHEFLVGRKDEYYIDPERSAVRSTLKGALKAYFRTYRPVQYVERIPTPGAEPVPIGGQKTQAAPALRYADWFFTFLLVFAIFLNFRGAARTPAQALFRAGLAAFAVLGVIVTAVARFVLKRQAARQ
jgi:hypothetical protein